MTGRQLIDAKKDEIQAVADRHGVRRLRIFGSVARGESGPESDVDFVVLFEEGRSLLDQASLLVDLQDLLGVEVDVISEGGINPRMRDRILNEAVPL